jgi:hypothetical protein
MVNYAALAAHQAACPLTQRATSSTSLLIEKRTVGGVEVLPMRDITATTCADALIARWPS